ncbi:MAG: hydrogen gas-evolving membrane-bound hydrogenase subunit E [Sediminispirochaetaceae bacterium]
MTEVFVNALLLVVVLTGTLTLFFRDLFVSVILLSIFSFLSALLFYVSHAPDVAITEAAVGAGMTTLIFIWAVRSCSVIGGPDARRLSDSRLIPELLHFSPGKIFDLLLVAAVGVCLYIFLPPLEGLPTFMRDFLVENGYADTGARNLVSAVYLGYRAFDTFGETIVLLCAVTGSIYFLSREH